MEQQTSYPQKIILKRTGDSVFEIGDSDEYLSRPHMCETCGKRFTLLENLNRHQMIHTDERPYLCDYCKKRFRLAQHLKEHIRIHTGEKPYQCPTCGRAFCQISNLKSHQKTHTKIKAFKCDICGKCFRRSFTLKQHKLTHTRRSYNGKCGSNLLPQAYRNLTRKMSVPTPTLIPSDNTLRRHSSSIGTSPEAAKQNFLQVPRDILTMRPYPNSAPSYFPQLPNGTIPDLAQHHIEPPATSSSMTAPFVERERPSQSSVEISQCPSLSALLRTDCDKQSIHVRNFPPMKSRQSASDACQYYGSIKNVPVIKVTPDTSVQATDENIIDGKVNYQSVSVRNCIHCEKGFSSDGALRDHVINEHRKKNRRRDSAYSSHSDKSPTTSPDTQKDSNTSILVRRADVTTLSPPRAHHIEASFMQRVKELALKSLGRYTKHQTVDHAKTDSKTEDHNAQQNSLPSDTRSESEYCPEVGHSPTDRDNQNNTIEESKANENSDNRDQENKIVKRAFDGSKKWKRELCKEWYEVPEQNNGEKLERSLDESSGSEDVKEPLEKRFKEENADAVNVKDAIASDVDIGNDKHEKISNVGIENGQSQTYGPIPDYNRFAPIVEWKPVVTGWKDMICGTLYALPPQAQHSYLGVQSPVSDPRFLYLNAPPSDTISTTGTTKSLDSQSSADEIHNTQKDSSPRFFRFSPHAISTYAIDNDSQALVTPDTPSSGIYSYLYPPDSLPLPGYSRLQHALLYQWDPNRSRLGGTSSVSNTNNLVSAT